MKILFVRVSAIGDVVHTIPAVFLIKSMIPSAQISWVVQAKAAEILKNQSFLDHVWVVPDKFWSIKHLPEMLGILKEIRQQRWDAVIDFQGILKTSLLLSCIKGKKYGFCFDHARSGPTSWITHHHTTPDYTNIVQKNLALASQAVADLVDVRECPSVDVLKNEIYLDFSPASKAKVDLWRSANNVKKLILITPNTTWPSKRWPDDCWSKLLMLLDNWKLQNQEISVAVVGKDFGKQANDLAAFCVAQNLNVLLVPRWDLLTTACLIKHSTLVVAPDTGLLHVADMLNCRTIGIFGPTNKLRHGPLLSESNVSNAIQVECPHYYQKTHGKNQNGSENYDCMYKLLPEQLFEKILENLN